MTGLQLAAAGTRTGQARITHGTAWLALSTGLEGVLNYAYALVATRLLPVEHYTVFAAGQALMLILGSAAGTAIPWVLARGLARAGGDRWARGQAVRFGVVANLVFGAVAAVLVWVVAGTFADRGEAVLLSGGTALLFASSTVWGYLQGEQRFLALALLRVVEVVGKVTVGVALMALGFGALGGLAGFGAGSVLVLALGIWLLRPDLGPSGRLRVGGALLRTTAGTTLVRGLLAVVSTADVILVAALAIPPDRAATYQVAMLLGRIPAFVAASVAIAVFPSLVARPLGMQPLMASSMRLMVSVVVPITLVVATIPAPLLVRLFGDRYGGLAVLLPVAACTGALTGLVTMLVTYAQARERFVRCGLVLAAGAVVQAAAITTGWHAAGIRGVAWGALVAALTMAVALLLQSTRAWPAPPRPATRGEITWWLLAGAALVVLRPTPLAWLAAAAGLGVTAALQTFLARPAAEHRHAPAGPPRPRVLHLGFEDPRRPGAGGGSVRTHEVNRRLAERFDITVVTAKFPGCRDRVEDGVRYLHVGLDRGYFASIVTYFACLPRVVRRLDYDLLVEDFAAPISSVLVPLFAKAPCVALVQWLWAREKARQYHLPFHWLEWSGVRLHTRMITPGEDLAGMLRRANPAADVQVIPNGVDPACFTVAEDQRPFALYLGRLEIAQKGLDVLLEAFARVAGTTTTRLVIAGDGRDQATLVARCHRLGISDRVEFVGRVQGAAKLALLASAQLVCMPSRQESFGIVAAEALACGTPVLACDIDNLRSVVPDGAGRLVPVSDVEAYAAALAELLRAPAACRSMGRRGRAFARRFDWDVIASQQELVYRRAMVGGPGGPPDRVHAGIAGTGGQAGVP